MREINIERIAPVRGTVRGWHIVLLFGLVFLLTFAGAYWLSKPVDPLYRLEWRSCMWGILTFAFFACVTAVVPELRRLFVDVVRGGHPASTTDVLIAVGIMLTWGLGASRMLVNYPIAVLAPDSALKLFSLGPRADAAPTPLLFAAFSAAVLAPITEEIIYRGYLLNLWLANHRFWTAVCASSVAFGLMHFTNALFATVMGLFIALVYIKYRSLVLCIALHALYNLLMLRPLLGQFFMEKDRATVTSLSSWRLELILALAFVPLSFVFWKRFRPQSTINS